ncbi:type II secretion system protein D precursor [bacterium BMS3Bbin12]|nr:type II secretion system protein D precursor [bacterium BMS3Abin12]GBE48229.1 type II secretion system protein D precursor [bacterium BMS3Bbin12]GBE50128.1 type II secretion system protein D precursor [bacterium BMS3Bbin13]
MQPTESEDASAIRRPLRPARLSAWLLLVWLVGTFPAPAAPSVPPDRGAAAGDTQQVTLNLKDTDIQALIATVAEVTGKNFVVDPRVKGKVTVISSRPVNQNELYQVFLSILQVHGFAAVPSGSVIKIVPDVTAKQDAIPVVTRRHPGVGDEMVTRVIHVSNVSAAQLVPILRPLIPQQGHLAAYPSSNMLVISDRADNVKRIARIIRRIDSSSSSGVDIVPLRHASAGDVVRILTSLLQSERRGRGGAGAAPVVVADERTNSVLIGGDASDRLRLKALVVHLDTAMQSTGNTQVVYLHYADAKKLVPVLQSVVKGQAAKGGKGAAAQAQDVEIAADESTNALVITAPPDVQRSLRGVISRLDIRRAQVLVEAVIAEVSADNAAQLGVQFNAAQNLDSGGPIGGTNFSAAGPSLTNMMQNPLSVGTGLSVGFIRGASTLFGTQVLNISTLIQALASESSTNILSTPTLLTLDNQEAEIIVGQNVPFVTGRYTNTGATAGVVTPFQTIQRHDVGLTLKVKPQINEGNTVKLQIQQEVSSLTNSTQAADVITNKRSIKTTVLVDSGRIVVLGGLIQETHKENEQKVPILGDLPVIGALFRSRQSQLNKTNLMVFLRPVILRDAGRARDYTDEKYDYIRAQQMALQSKGVFLMPGEKAPMLPRLPAPGADTRLPPPFEPRSPAPARPRAAASGSH